MVMLFGTLKRSMRGESGEVSWTGGLGAGAGTMPGTSSWRTDTRMQGLTAERAAQRADVGESSGLLELVLFVTLDMVDDGDEMETESKFCTQQGLAHSYLYTDLEFCTQQGLAHSYLFTDLEFCTQHGLAHSYRISNGGISSDEGN